MNVRVEGIIHFNVKTVNTTQVFVGDVNATRLLNFEASSEFYSY